MKEWFRLELCSEGPRSFWITTFLKCSFFIWLWCILYLSLENFQLFFSIHMYLYFKINTSVWSFHYKHFFLQIQFIYSLKSVYKVIWDLNMHFQHVCCPYTIYFYLRKLRHCRTTFLKLDFFSPAVSFCSVLFVFWLFFFFPLSCWLWPF